MDYRSPFELRQQLMEESRNNKSPSNKLSNSRGKAGASPPHPPSHSSTSASVGSHSSTPFMPSTTLPDDPTALVREVPGAENLKALNAALEQAEAVQRYMENENLSLEDSVTYLMENGSTAQKVSFFSHMRDSLVDLSQKRIAKLLSILLDSMWAQDPELQCKAPEDLLGLMGILSSQTAGELFEITQTMLTVKTAEVRVAWGKLLLGLISCSNAEQLERDMIPLALTKSEHAQPQDQRELSCRLLGGLCEFMTKEKVEECILPRALALCQDTNVGVRQCMCQQLGSIARSLGVDTAKQKISPDLFELLNDEDRAVSRAAFSCVLDLVEFFGPEYRKEKLYPIIKSYVSSSPSEVTSLLIVEYGRLLDKIKGDITTEEDVVLFARFFETAVLLSDDEARRNCAFNFPAVTASLPLSVFHSYLSPCLNTLASDADVQVRRSVAAGLHEMVPLLGDQAAAYLEKPFLALLRDRDRSVRTVFFKNIHPLMECFVRHISGTMQKRAFFRNVADIILEQIPSCKSNWRELRNFTRLISRYIQCFDEATVADSFAPLVLAALKDGAVALKDDCAVVIVVILKCITAAATRVQLLSRLNNEFAHSSSCYHRQSYLRFVREACRQFSRRCVRERMMESCFELQRDAVPSVRVHLARTLPALSKGLRAGSSGAVEEEFNNMLQRLLMDPDEEVRAAAQESKSTMSRAEKERRMHPRRMEEAEQQDQRLEKAEQAMLDLAKECDKAERRAKLRDMLKGDRDKDAPESSGNSASISSRKGPSAGGGRDLNSGASINVPSTAPSRRKNLRNPSGVSPSPLSGSTHPGTLPRISQGRHPTGMIPSSSSRKRL